MKGTICWTPYTCGNRTSKYYNIPFLARSFTSLVFSLLLTKKTKTADLNIKFGKQALIQYKHELNSWIATKSVKNLFLLRLIWCFLKTYYKQYVIITILLSAYGTIFLFCSLILFLSIFPSVLSWKSNSSWPQDLSASEQHHILYWKALRFDLSFGRVYKCRKFSKRFVWILHKTSDICLKFKNSTFVIRVLDFFFGNPTK